MIQNLDISNSIPDGLFKDESPISTVEKIKGILDSYGIEAEESWRETSVPYCYAMGVRIVGTSFSVNGKGLTKEFTLASAYGELMERLQLGFVGGPSIQKDGGLSMESGKNDMIPAEKLLSENRGWYELMSKRFYQYTGSRLEPETIVRQYANAEGLVPSTAYYNLVKGTREYLPTELRKRVYTSNGCAAGNTAEETLVQGISELVERYHLIRIVEEQLTLPDIPEDVLKKYKISYDIISYIRDQGFRVGVKDCSLGTSFPVVCVYMIDEKTGRYHTHFGAYPIFEIALERSLTETFQGRRIDQVARFENFSTKKIGEYSYAAIANEYTKGTWEKNIGFFIGEPQYTFNENMGFTGKNNKELLRQCVEYFSSQGYDILVRDVSCLGFHTYQILIPGYSEVFFHRLSAQMEDNRYAAYATKTLRNPSSANFQDMLGLLMHIDQMQKFTSNITDTRGFLAGAKLSANISTSEENFLMSASLGYVYYALGRHDEVIKCVSSMIPKSTGEETEYLICLKRYLSMKKNRYDADQIKAVLSVFHRPETIQKLYTCLDKKANPLDEFTLHCNMSCDESCQLYASCCQQRSMELFALIRKKTDELDFEKFAEELEALR